jgi:hypothetical protein
VRACAAAANHPRKKDLRESLYDALRPVANLGSVDDATYSAHFLYLLRQTAVWADIVRCRIENSRNSIVSTPVESIQYPARDLQQLLVQLVGDLNSPKSPDSWTAPPGRYYPPTDRDAPRQPQDSNGRR